MNDDSESKSRVNAQLDKALRQLLTEVMKPHQNPADNASLTDRCKVIDRVLKWEAVKGKLNDGNWGAGFADDSIDDE